MKRITFMLQVDVKRRRIPRQLTKILIWLPMSCIKGHKIKVEKLIVENQSLCKTTDLALLALNCERKRLMQARKNILEKEVVPIVLPILLEKR
jgi:hypothetical protein